MKIHDKSLLSALDGKKPLDVKDVLLRARSLCSKNIFTLVISLLMVFAIIFAFGVVLVSTFNITKLEDIERLQTEAGAMLGFVSTIVLAPLWAGVSMMSINSLRHKPIKASDVFAYFSFLPALGLSAVIVSILTEIGFALLVLPGLYVFMASVFVAPLIVEKKLGPISAIALSVRMVNAYFNQIAVIFLVLILLMIAVALSFGLAYIWVGPFYFNVKAILYQDLFSVVDEQDSSSNAPSQTNENTGVFDA
ncbi:hypothetical protein [Agaribacter flavus]|uniref:Integral membrane protein n=1 Tax=Agaribacter flavus TaxID=1902781 RepID=A0ABV7FTE7_9ALTE